MKRTTTDKILKSVYIPNNTQEYGLYCYMNSNIGYR